MSNPESSNPRPDIFISENEKLNYLVGLSESGDTDWEDDMEDSQGQYYGNDPEPAGEPSTKTTPAKKRKVENIDSILRGPAEASAFKYVPTS